MAAVERRAELRDRAGKGAARSRRSRPVPAVIYGDKKDPIMISLDRKELVSAACTSGVSHAPCSTSRSTARPRSRAAARRASSIRSPTAACMSTSCASAKAPGCTSTCRCTFINERESPGLKRGGVLNIVRHEIELVRPGRRDPAVRRGRPDRPRHRRLDPHLSDRSCRRAPSRPSATRLHRRHDRRRRVRLHGVEEGAAEAAAAGAAAPMARLRPRAPRARRGRGRRRRCPSGGDAKAAGDAGGKGSGKG